MYAGVRPTPPVIAIREMVNRSASLCSLLILATTIVLSASSSALGACEPQAHRATREAIRCNNATQVRDYATASRYCLLTAEQFLNYADEQACPGVDYAASRVLEAEYLGKEAHALRKIGQTAEADRYKREAISILKWVILRYPSYKPTALAFLQQVIDGSPY